MGQFQGTLMFVQVMVVQCGVGFLSFANTMDQWDGQKESGSNSFDVVIKITSTNEPFSNFSNSTTPVVGSHLLPSRLILSRALRHSCKAVIKSLSDTAGVIPLTCKIGLVRNIGGTGLAILRRMPEVEDGSLAARSGEVKNQGYVPPVR